MSFFAEISSSFRLLRARHLKLYTFRQQPCSETKRIVRPAVQIYDCGHTPRTNACDRSYLAGFFATSSGRSSSGGSYCNVTDLGSYKSQRCRDGFQLIAMEQRITCHPTSWGKPNLERHCIAQTWERCAVCRIRVSGGRHDQRAAIVSS